MLAGASDDAVIVSARLLKQGWGIKKIEDIPLSRALAVRARARVPDAFVGHGVLLFVSLWYC